MGGTKGTDSGGGAGTSSNGSTSDGSTDRPAENDAVALALIRAAVELGGRFIAAVLDRWVIIALIAATVVLSLGYVALLPDEDRSGAHGLFLSVVQTIGDVVGAAWFGWIGWMLLAVVLPAGGLFIWFQDKRLKVQGKELQRLRQLLDPERISSEDPAALARYAEQRDLMPRAETSAAAGGEADPAESPRRDVQPHTKRAKQQKKKKS